MSSCSDVMLSEEMKSLEQIIFAFFNAENHDSPRQGFQEIVPSFAPPEDHRKRLLRSTSFPPLANGKDYCDSPWSSSATTTTAHLRGSHIHDSRSGYYFSDANQSDAGGDLALNPTSGLISVTTGRGELFYKVHRRSIVDTSGHIVSECFSLQSSSNKDLYLAMNRDSPYYTVQGLTKKAMGDISNSFWRYIPFSDIGYSPPGSGYIALQYWGNHFGSPSTAAYYFVMDLKSKSAPFRIAPKEIAAQLGRLGHRDSQS